MSELLEITTDGACFGNPGPGGFAAIIIDGSDRREVVGGEEETTNNRMELLAAIEGLEALSGPSRVRIRSDSTYVIKGMTEWVAGWQRRNYRKVKNPDLWKRLVKAAAPHRVQWVHVWGHAGDPLNEQADLLAKAEAERAQRGEARGATTLDAAPGAARPVVPSGPKLGQPGARLDLRLDLVCEAEGERPIRCRSRRCGLHCLVAEEEEDPCPHARLGEGGELRLSGIGADDHRPLEGPEAGALLVALLRLLGE